MIRPRLLLPILVSLFGCDDTPECAGGVCVPLGCEASDPCCTSESLTPEECGAPPATSDGWDDPAGAGPVFVVDRLSIAPRNFGADLDGACDGDGCLDNVLWKVGELGNPGGPLRQLLLGGEGLLLIEISGLLPDYRGWDRSVTVKLYAALDADDPPFAANNFKTPPGQTTCCEFLVHPDSLVGDRARVRFAAQIRDGHLETLERGEVLIPVQSEVPPYPLLEFAKAGIDLDLPSDTAEIQRGIFTGAWRARSSGSIGNPNCKTVSPRCPSTNPESSTLFDLFAMFGLRPDIDLDGDGVECAYDSDGEGAIDLCCDGAGQATCGGPAVCAGAIIPPLGAETPGSCVRNLADGHSIAMLLDGVRATIRGTSL